MILKLRETWISVQKAETMLFRAAALPKISQYRKLLEDFGLENGLLGLLIRMINGFNPDNLTPQDYLIRYPYSSVEAIKAGMEQLVESGHILLNKTVNYAATEHAKQGV